MPPWNRRSLICSGVSAMMFGALAAPLSFSAEASRRSAGFEKDFDSLWRTLRDRYCFFAEKQTDWDKVRTLYRPMALQAATAEAFAEVVRLVLAELYDAHTHLAQPPMGALRWPLFDIMAERRGDALAIAAIDAGSAAEQGGLAIGDAITAIDGVSIEDALALLRPRCMAQPDAEAESYIANVAVAGKRGQARQFLVRNPDGTPRTVDLPLLKRAQLPDIEWRRLDNNVGYIVLRSFGDEATVGLFDSALLDLRDAPGLIIDVRQNGGGDTAVARPIMGRFIKARKPYAMMRRRQGEGLGAPWTEYVDPRGPFTYEAPVVVLTGHWSASMAEGFPMGMRGIGRATIVGTKMMGLGAAVFSETLKHSKVAFQYSAEPIYDILDRPRWHMEPDITVPDGEDALAAGLDALARVR